MWFMTALDVKRSRRPSTACGLAARWCRWARPRERRRANRGQGTLNAKGSLFLTRPGLFAHATNIDEYGERVRDVFDALESGVITSSISKTYALADAAQAHAALETGKAGGTIILRP